MTDLSAHWAHPRGSQRAGLGGPVVSGPREPGLMTLGGSEMKSEQTAGRPEAIASPGAAWMSPAPLAKGGMCSEAGNAEAGLFCPELRVPATASRPGLYSRVTRPQGLGEPKPAQGGGKALSTLGLEWEEGNTFD